jgi:SAM-dependent methyltransferase
MSANEVVASMKIRRSDIETLVDSTIREEFSHFDLDLRGDRVTSENPEIPVYLLKLRQDYIRTIFDVARFVENGGTKRILEIGAFFGIVSICLAKMGFQVVAADIPEYMSLPEQVERFSRHGITTANVRLQDYVLPFQDECFDAIIMCEVLEHLNFNPLPLIKEINRVGGPDSLFYLSLPNQAYYKHRLKLLFGYSVLQPIQGYFDQLDPKKSDIVNGHWREYTGYEIADMLQRMGYGIFRQYYFSVVDDLKDPTLKNRFTRLVFGIVPSWKENQTTLAVRKTRTNLPFRIPKTVHPTLDRI